MNTREQVLDQKGKCQKKLKSPISNRNWCDINTLGVIPKLYKMCLNPESKCQKQITFPPRQYKLKKNGFKNKYQQKFRWSEDAWNKFSNPAVNGAASFIGKAVSAKTKHPKTWQRTTKFSKNL